MKLIANDVSVWTAVEPVFLMEQFVYFSFKMVDFEMSGFEPQASWIGNNCNVPLATTTALNPLCHMFWIGTKRVWGIQCDQMME